jgi:hypothetical protein
MISSAPPFDNTRICRKLFRARAPRDHVLVEQNRDAAGVEIAARGMFAVFQ